MPSPEPEPRLESPKGLSVGDGTTQCELGQEAHGKPVDIDRSAERAPVRTSSTGPDRMPRSGPLGGTWAQAHPRGCPNSCPGAPPAQTHRRPDDIQARSRWLTVVRASAWRLPADRSSSTDSGRRSEASITSRAHGLVPQPGQEIGQASARFYKDQIPALVGSRRNR
jgi:hypothetical protein